MKSIEDLINSTNDDVVYVSFKGGNDNKTPMQSTLKRSAMNYSNNQETESNPGPFIFSFNFVFIATILIYATMLFFPKAVQKRLLRVIDRRKHTGDDLVLDENNNTPSSYQNGKKEYRNLFPIGGRSLADDDEESAMPTSGRTSTSKEDEASTRSSCAVMSAGTSTSNIKKRDKSRVHKHESGATEVISPRSRLLLSRRPNYGSSLTALDTNFISTCIVGKANLADNDELSPLGKLDFETNNYDIPFTFDK